MSLVDLVDLQVLGDERGQLVVLEAQKMSHLTLSGFIFSWVRDLAYRVVFMLIESCCRRLSVSRVSVAC